MRIPEGLKAHFTGRKLLWAGGLILLGVVGKLLLHPFANIETVLAASLLAGYLLGGPYAIIVPLSIMAVHDWVAYTVIYQNTYGLGAILGLGFFLASGFVVASAMGLGARRPRVVLRTKTVAVLTTVGVAATLLFDVWTAFGEWLFVDQQRHSFYYVLQLQVPFSLLHLISTLIFVPIFGTLSLFLHEHPAVSPEPEGIAQEAPT